MACRARGSKIDPKITPKIEAKGLSGVQNQAQKAPKIEAKSLPGGFKMASKRVSKKASMLDPILKLFL